MQTTTNEQKLAILHNNRDAFAVYDHPANNGATTTILVRATHGLQPLLLPANVPILSVQLRIAQPFHDLRLPLKYADEQCYNEPVPGGVQIQPQAAGWVGTLGACCRFDSRDGHQRWGVLSNYHVLCTPGCRAGHPIHQPRDSRPAIAHLEDWEPVTGAVAMEFDAAVADAKIDHLHTCGPEIRCLGPLAPEILDPQIGQACAKCGRTSDLTEGIVMAVDAAVTVNYGDFEASFVNQILIAGNTLDFSAPGDSGSLIFAQPGRNPLALLFAGSPLLTVGSPMRAIAKRFNLSFQFPESRQCVASR